NASQAASSDGIKIGNTTVDIGGYVKLDMIYDFDQALGDSLFVAGLDTANNESNGVFRAHARQSRISIGTITPTDAGVVKTRFEGDFFGGGGNEVFSNSSGLRIRHAYGELGGLLAGQTWSNFMHFTAYPSTVDFDGPVGVSFIRQAQVRYTMPMGGGALSVSAENAETTGFEGSRDVLPDFTARYKWAGDGGGFEFAGLARQLQSDSAVGDDSAFAYGLMLAGRLNVTNSTTLMAGAIFGDGVGRYIYSSFSNNVSANQDGQLSDPTDPTSGLNRSGIGEAYIDANGDLETIEAFGFNVAVSQKWTPKFTSGLSYGRVEGDQPDNLFPNSFETLQSVHFSNFYQIADPVTLGLELSFADKELMNGESSDNTRLQASAQFSF
ncbi:DcaP family trimeric outer membrane transporter, partial [Marinobacter sp. ELB17]|uniref:DcaP family trimeric outer membrane transporter n=1 Tax=Marinobacter sp. ELB17 TaxID=270374 RepID=UPI0000F39AED